MISNMDRVLRSNRMAPGIKEEIIKATSRDMESFIGLMGVAMNWNVEGK